MKPSRRDALLSVLPAAAVAGCGAADTPLPPGEIVGASDTVGHRLRTGWRPEVPADKWETAGTVIVGGGVAGLAAAWRLVRKGDTDFTLLELEPHPGGTARGGESPFGLHPWGAHYVPAPLAGNPTLVELLTEIGVVMGGEPDGTPIIAEESLCRDPAERVFYRGRWYEGLYLHAGQTAADIADLHRFQTEVGKWVAWRDGKGRPAFAVPTSRCSDDPVVTALDRVSMADWLRRNNFTSDRLKWLVAYACRDDYGLLPEHASAWAGLFYFAARQRTPTAEAQPQMTWPDGNGRLVRHLFDAVKSKTRLGWTAFDVSPIANGVDVRAVNYDGSEVRGFRAKRVIFAAPQYVARRVVKPLRENPPPAAFTYGAWLVANLHVSDRPGGLGFPFAWDNVLYESDGLGYVVNTHQLGTDRGPAVLTYYKPLTDADPAAARTRLLSLTRDECADAVLADLGKAHPELRTLTTRLDVCRWGHAMVRPVPGFRWGEARRKANESIGNIHFAGADLSGIPVFEEAFDSGVRAADAVLSRPDRGRG